MKIAIFLALALLAMVPRANAQSRFEQVSQMYDQGTPLTSSDLEAAYAGRCFKIDPSDKTSTENDATGAILVGKLFPAKPMDNAGPAFPASPGRLLINVFNAINNDVYYRFENWTYDSAVNRLLKSSDTKSTPAVVGVTETSWRTTYNTGAKGEFLARRYQNYIVVKGLNTAVKPAGRFACYYFKKLP